MHFFFRDTKQKKNLEITRSIVTNYKSWCFQHEFFATILLCICSKLRLEWNIIDNYNMIYVEKNYELMKFRTYLFPRFVWHLLYCMQCLRLLWMLLLCVIMKKKNNNSTSKIIVWERWWHTRTQPLLFYSRSHYLYEYKIIRYTSLRLAIMWI